MSVRNRLLPAMISTARVAAVLLAAVALDARVAPAGAQARNVQQIETSSRIKAWLVEERSIPLVSIKLSFAGGALQDPPGKEGLTGLMAALLTEGAGGHDSDAYARRLADEGAQIAFSGSRDQLHGGLDALAKRIDASADLLRLALTVPRFDADAFERARQQKLSDLELADSEPRNVAFNRWYADAFPAHPYSRPLSGTPASVAAITREDIVAQHKRLLSRQALRIVMVGDIDKAGAIQLIEKTFGSLPGEAALEPVSKPAQTRISEPVVIQKDIPLATVAFGAVTLPPGHADYPALQVLTHIIGSGDFDATLMEEIRVKRGLAYAVSMSLVHDSLQSILLGGMSTKNENMLEALRVLRDVIAATAAKGPTAAQVDNAKRYLTGSFLLDYDTNAKLAASLLRLWGEGKEPAFLAGRNAGLQRVTHDDVRRVAREALAWERFNVTVVGNPATPRP